MSHAVRWTAEDEPELSGGMPPPTRLSFLRFLQRYPIFVLAFGPPLFRSAAIDATKGKIDFWSILQVGLLSSIALRATLRLAFARAVFIPKRLQSVLKYAFFLGLLFLASAVYSPSHFVSMAYSVAYFLTFISVVEFTVDVSKHPINLMQCLFHLRLIALLLLALDFIVLFFDPKLVTTTEGGAGVRFEGGLVGTVTLIAPMIAIISAYTFLHLLEPKGRSAFFFLLGLACSLSAQSRGCEVSLLLSLSVLAFRWAKAGRHSAYIAISSFIVSVLFFGLFIESFGGGRIWRIINRGQSAEGIATGSGRTEIWKFVVQYCLKHPLGMGYVAGFRMIFREYSAVGIMFTPGSFGNAHNCYFQALADAGWLALAVYLIMLTKIVRLAWRFSAQRSYPGLPQGSLYRKPLECSMFLLVYCLAAGMDSSGSAVPLAAAFYWMNIIIAIILGISARLFILSRSRYLDPTRQFAA